MQYYKNASACVVVFDVTRPTTFQVCSSPLLKQWLLDQPSWFQNVQQWKAELDDKVLQADGTPIPVLLMANKVTAASLALLHAAVLSYTSD